MGIKGIFVIMGNITLRTLDYGKYGVFFVMGNAGCISSTVSPVTTKGKVEGFSR